MIDTPRILRTTARPTALIHVVVPEDKIQDVMGPTLQELIGAVTAQRISISGPWFTHHLRRPSDNFDFEVSVPVSQPIKSIGRVQAGEWPVMTVAQTIYHGDYEGLGDAWSEFIDWIEANGHTPTQELWEVYSVGPETTSNPNDWRTELNQPLLNPD